MKHLTKVQGVPSNDRTIADGQAQRRLSGRLPARLQELRGRLLRSAATSPFLSMPLCCAEDRGCVRGEPAVDQLDQITVMMNHQDLRECVCWGVFLTAVSAGVCLDRRPRGRVCWGVSWRRQALGWYGWLVEVVYHLVHLLFFVRAGPYLWPWLAPFGRCSPHRSHSPSTRRRRLGHRVLGWGARGPVGPRQPQCLRQAPGPGTAREPAGRRGHDQQHGAERSAGTGLASMQR